MAHPTIFQLLGELEERLCVRFCVTLRARRWAHLKFTSIGARRTQTVGGHVLETAPFHWDGYYAQHRR
jgi:hypothetical protein